MRRDVSALTARTFDVLIVGGGIYGLTLAYDAAQRGLSVALVEREDFGSGSSFNHLRTIHGGLRYLQHLDLARARESIRERRILARLAPHTLQRLAFVLPLTRSLARGPLAMRAGFLLDAALAGDRNRGVPEPLRLPRGTVVSAAFAAERFPGIRRRGLAGAAIWHDYVTVAPDRLTLSWALAAAQCGAVLVNHVEAAALLRDGARVVGVRAIDKTSSRPLDIAARLTINATGGAIDRLIAADRAEPTPLVLAMNVVTRRDAGAEALGGRSASGRNLFMVPWRGRALFGTWESTHPVTSDCAVSEDAVGQFIGELNEAFPALDLDRREVTLVHRGIVPAERTAAGGLTLAKREVVHDHERLGTPGLMSVAGTKYTTARGVAERVIDTALTRLGEAPRRCQTAERPLPGGQLRHVARGIADARRQHDAQLPSDTIPHLVTAYGSGSADIIALALERPEWRTRLADDSPVIGAELVWAARHEMVVTLADAVVRRTPLGALGHPGSEAVRRAAAIVGAELTWTDDRVRAEVQALEAFYGT